ncbi:MAG: DNA-formamidopyrimidine glycosylase family protein [Gemmatimonadaceae bacterium]
MPELPDVQLYVEALRAHVVGHELAGIRLSSPFVLRSVEPALSEVVGRRITGVERLGKRIVLAFEGELYLVIHLMIAGRLRWRAPGGKAPGKLGLATFSFDHGVLILTEAGTKRRASLHLVKGAEVLARMDRGGLEIMGSSVADFAQRLRSENHTIKRSLTDPRLFSGIGNAYSDEILHRARLSPMLLTSRMTDAQIATLHGATVAVMSEWIERLRGEASGGFPEKVTAFRPEMAVHGKFRQPCPVCGAPVQRIRYADNETNYCAKCQTEGRVLADRALSRLLKEDFPRTLVEMGDD